MTLNQRDLGGMPRDEQYDNKIHPVFGQTQNKAETRVYATHPTFYGLLELNVNLKDIYGTKLRKESVTTSNITHSCVNEVQLTEKTSVSAGPNVSKGMKKEVMPLIN